VELQIQKNSKQPAQYTEIREFRDIWTTDMHAQTKAILGLESIMYKICNIVI